MVRLLTKQEIDRTKASETRREIDEGIKVARRVDALRRTHADEEASLEKFRNSKVQKIHQEIEKEDLKRQILCGEILELEKRKEDALKPLTEEEERLDKKRIELEDAESRVKALKKESDKFHKEVTQGLTEAKNERLRASNAKERAQELQADAHSIREEAKQRLLEAQSIHNNALSFEKEKNSELGLRERKLDANENLYSERQKKQDEERATLDKEWKKLKDRKELLERNTRRLTYDNISTRRKLRTNTKL